MEEWKKITGYSDYEVSSFGNVRNIETKELVKTKKNGLGHVRISLPKEHGTTNILLYKLVCQAFKQNFNTKSKVTHTDNNFSNNAASNLSIIIEQKFSFRNCLAVDSDWKSIKDYPNYLISKNGNIYSIYQKKFLKISVDYHGYKRVSLSNAKGRNKHSLHRLIALAFIPLIKGKNVINHKNGIKTDNSIENLEWVTSQENAKHASDTKLNDSSKKKKSRAIHVNQYTMDGEFVKEWNSVREASVALNIGRTLIYEACEKDGRRKSTGGFKWEYVESNTDDLEGEIWKKNPGTFDTYMISNMGRIKNLKGKILLPHKRTDGYYSINLQKKKIRKTQSVHRIIAECFIPNPKKLPFVNHINGIKDNNRVSNLEWVTESGNAQHAHKTGLINIKSKKVNQYDLDGNFIKKWNSVREAAEYYKCRTESIRTVCVKQNITGIGFKWEYAE